MIPVLLTALCLAPEVWPGAHWEHTSAAQAGLDEAALRRFAEQIGGRGCVVRHGRIAFEWGDPTARGDVASAAKPVYMHFLLAALQDGRIPSLDEAVSRYEPRLSGLDRAITWRHLGTQTSCYGLVEAPGTAFAYNDWSMALYWDLLFGKVWGASFDDVDETVLRPLLTDIIACEDSPTLMAFGTEDRPGRLAISPRDFARFGMVYLHGGRWRERQLLDPDLARMAVTTPLPADLPRAGDQAAPLLPDARSLGSRAVPDNQCDHRGSYSYFWWINGVDSAGESRWPAAPNETYGCFGHGGREAMVVFPSLDLIVSWNEARIDNLDAERAAMATLMTGLPPPGTVTIDPLRADRLIRAPDTPLYLCGPGDPEDFLYRAGDQEAIIGRVAAAGANTLYWQIVRSHGGDGDATHNPFIGHDPAKGLDDAVLARWEAWLAATDRAGIVPLVFLYDDSTRIWETGDDVGAAERAFVTGIVERLRSHQLIWCIAEEYEEALTPVRAAVLAAIIRELDPWHPIAVHKLNGLDFAEFADDPNIDLFAVQYNEPDPARLRAALEQVVREADGRYAVLLAECADMGTGAGLREKLELCLELGVGVMVLGMDGVTTAPGDLAMCGEMIRSGR